MASFVSEFDDMMGSVCGAQYGVLGDSGVWVASGAAINLKSTGGIPCYIEGKAHSVTNAQGEEVAARLKVVTNSLNGLTVKGFRFTLPAAYTPRLKQEAVMIEIVEDETGPIYEVIHI